MTTFPPILYKGSVKNVRGEVSEKIEGESFIFEYSDRFSVFDWGEMPDHIDEKGTALNLMGYGFFKYLENRENWINLFESLELEIYSKDFLHELKESKEYKSFCQNGLTHHMLSLVSNSGEVVEKVLKSHYLKVKKINVIRPKLENKKYNYESYRSKMINSLVPLEIIFRLGLAKGNSFSKRITESMLSDFELGQLPYEGSFLEKPIIDFSTKLENTDRYLDYKEAKEISGMSAEEFNSLKIFTTLVGLNLFVLHKKLGLTLWDGKIEVAFIKDESSESRTFMLVDSIGIDELRLIVDGKSMSKEFLREIYKETSWFEDIQKSKEESKQTGVDFREICKVKYKSSPPSLSLENKERSISVYKSYCNSLFTILNFPTPFEEKYSIKNYREKYL